jgi:hypothetical protein
MKVGDDYKLNEDASLRDVIITHNLLFDRLQIIFENIKNEFTDSSKSKEYIWDILHVLLSKTEEGLKSCICDKCLEGN